MEKDLKAIICKAIDDREDDLNHVSQEIWKNPELNFEERFAHRLLTTFLENEGFKVHKSYPIETSFVAKYGNNIEQRVRIGIICEYDALPGIGHACGHNLIAEAGIGAAIGENIYKLTCKYVHVMNLGMYVCMYVCMHVYIYVL